MLQRALCNFLIRIAEIALSTCRKSHDVGCISQDHTYEHVPQPVVDGEIFCSSARAGCAFSAGLLLQGRQSSDWHQADVVRPVGEAHALPWEKSIVAYLGRNAEVSALRQPGIRRQFHPLRKLKQVNTPAEGQKRLKRYHKKKNKKRHCQYDEKSKGERPKKAALLFWKARSKFLFL